jgi:hypothetical protein
MKRRIAAALAVVGVASLVTLLQVEASHETDDQIGTEAVWNAAGEDLNEISKVCKTGQTDYKKCFIEQMGDYASSDAVAFSQQMAAQKPSRLGYLDGMREAGLVDLGYVVYPDGAKSKQGWVLMNGVPALVNVDNLFMLPQSAMAKDPQFAALRKNHPQIQLAVTDDQRRSDTEPQIETHTDGGERFLVPYSLQENCNGCAPVGRAIFGFDFDAAGQFQGVKFIRVTAERP